MRANRSQDDRTQREGLLVRRKRPSTFLRHALTFSVAAVLVITACSSGSSSPDGDAGATSPEDRDEPPEPEPVTLEPLGSVLPDPFVPETLDIVESGAESLEDARDSGALGSSLADPPERSQEVGAELSGYEAAGNEPGLYGGSLDESSCDIDQLEEFLTGGSNAGEADAWAEVLGIETGDIADYLDGLTPVRLRLDTRVTNHTYVDGAASPTQSLLQAGTAVLVDSHGVPRVLCSCGNPLAEPASLASGRDEQAALDLDEVATNPDDAWDGLQPRSVVVVIVEVEIEVVVLYDFESGELFERPAGTDGNADAPYESAETTTTTTTDTTTTTQPPPPTVPTVPAAAEVGDCAELDAAFTQIVGVGECGPGTSATYRVVDVVDILGSCPSSNQPYISSGDFLLCMELEVHEGYCYQFYTFPDGHHVTAADCNTSDVHHIYAVVPGATLDQAESVCPSDLAWTAAYEVYAPQMLLCTAGTG